jgi:hypothetical protein
MGFVDGAIEGAIIGVIVDFEVGLLLGFREGFPDGLEDGIIELETLGTDVGLKMTEGVVVSGEDLQASL